MTIVRCRCCAVAMLLALFVLHSFGADSDEAKITLKVGSPAPALQTGTWLNGDAVKQFESGKVYVVEFWATWCGPCKKSIPHLSEMNTEFKDKGVTVIGVDCWERDASRVAPFVKTMGEKMNYRVAVDEPIGDAGANVRAWMNAAGQNGIPCAFVVDKKGKIAWIGNPMGDLHGVLEKVVAGNFDAAKEAERSVKQREFQKRFSVAAKAGDSDALQTIADEMAAADPEAAGRVYSKVFGFMLAQKRDYDGAYAYARKITEKHADDAGLHNAIAWTILDTPSVEKRDVALALRLAHKADDMTKHENSAILDTLARAYFEQKNVARAVEIQALAVEKADGAGKLKLDERLRKYKEAVR